MSLAVYRFGSDSGFYEGNRWNRHFWSIVVYGRGGGDIGEPNISLLLAKMPLGGCKRLGEMIAEELQGEARPSSVRASVNGLGPC